MDRLSLSQIKLNTEARNDYLLETRLGRRHLDGVICGHIHQAADVWYGKTHYLNSGDWVESMTALVEDGQGAWRILRYTDVYDFLQAEAI